MHTIHKNILNYFLQFELIHYSQKDKHIIIGMIITFGHFLPETLDLKLKLPNPHDLGSKNGTSIVLFEVKSALKSYASSLISMTVDEFRK